MGFITIVHLFYGTSDKQLQGLVGFTVNMDWVREHYFGDIIQQIARVGGGEDAIALLITRRQAADCGDEWNRKGRWSGA